MARVFVSDLRPSVWEGQDAVQLLVTVLEGEVAVGDVFECGARAVALSQTCSSCSFGQTLQEGDRGSVTVVPASAVLVSPGSTVQVDGPAAG